MGLLYNGLTRILASFVNVNDIPRTPGSSSNPASTQAEGHKPLPVVGPVPVPVATQFQGAQGFNVSGNTQFTNVGMNTGNLTTVNNYGGTHGVLTLCFIDCLV